MFNGAVVGNKINTIIKSQPEIALVVEKNTQHIVVLQTFSFRKSLNNVSFKIDNINATVICCQRHPLLINRSSGIDALTLKQAVIRRG